MSAFDHQLVSEVLGGLASRRRRCVVAYLLDSERERVPFDRLVEYVERQTGSPPDDRDAVATSLDHRHLPVLADAGLVRYERGEFVSATDRTDVAEPYLSFAGRREEEGDIDA